MNNWSKLLLKSRREIIKHGPDILIGMGIAGLWGAVALTIPATNKSLKQIEKESDELGSIDLPKKMVVKLTWKNYIPTIATAAVSTGCILGAHKINMKRNLALASAYTITRTALTEYKDTLLENLGKEKEQEIRNKIAKKTIEKHPEVKPVSNAVVIAGGERILCLDAISGQYFYSNMNDIDKAVNQLNSRLINEMYISLNDFYYELGLKNSEIGDGIGWNVDDGLIEITYATQIADNNQPCLVIEYVVAPRYDYINLH